MMLKERPGPSAGRKSGRLDGNDRRLLDIAQHHIERVNGIIKHALQLPDGACHVQHLLPADWLNGFVEDAIDCERFNATAGVRLNLVELCEKGGYFRVGFAHIL